MENTAVKVGPKDFFLFLGILVFLYTSAVTFITYLFKIIDLTFPDRQNYFYDPSSSLKITISILIVAVPILVALLLYVVRYLNNNPERKEMWIRKWLIYLTLFITGISVAADLIILINYFLDGEITSRFILKVVSVFIVAAIIFIFTLKDLKGEFIDNPKRAKIFLGAVCIVILAAIVYGFVLVGSPQKARQLSDDQTRIADLQNIQYQIVNYWQSKESLPPSIGDLNDPLSYFIVPVDPATGEQYGYNINGNLIFELCANFNLSGDSINSPIGSTAPIREPVSLEYPQKGIDSNWAHPVGYYCFERTIDPDLYPPYNSRVK